MPIGSLALRAKAIFYPPVDETRKGKSGVMTRSKTGRYINHKVSRVHAMRRSEGDPARFRLDGDALPSRRNPPIPARPLPQRLNRIEKSKTCWSSTGVIRSLLAGAPAFVLVVRIGKEKIFFQRGKRDIGCFSGIDFDRVGFTVPTLWAPIIDPWYQAVVRTYSKYSRPLP